MIVSMQTERLQTLEQIRGFVGGNEEVEFKLAERGSAYGLVRRTLVQFGTGWGRGTRGRCGGIWGR